MSTANETIQTAVAAYRQSMTELSAAKEARKTAQEAFSQAGDRLDAAHDKAQAAEQLLRQASLDTSVNEVIAKGDVVRLLSGGPWMTVEAVNEAKATCVWHSPDGFQTRPFYLAALEKSQQG